MFFVETKRPYTNYSCCYGFVLFSPPRVVFTLFPPHPYTNLYIYCYTVFARPKKQVFYFRIATPTKYTRPGESSPLQELEYPARSLVSSALEYRQDLKDKFVVTNSGIQSLLGEKIWGKIFPKVKLTKEFLYGTNGNNESGILMNALRRMNI